MVSEQFAAITGEEPVVTIRISGVPAHITDADFNCWFIFAPGFEQATLAPSKGPGVPQAGWARFSTPELAQSAIHHLNGRRLTPDQYPEGATLMAEFSKRNFRPRNHMKQVAPATSLVEEFSSDSVWSGGGGGGGGGSGAATWRPAAQSAGCSTLFVWRCLADSAEEEIRQLCVEQCAGFERMKFVPPANGKTGMCFLKFTQHGEAAAALEVLRGYALSASPTEAMHVDFAKAELDEPKRPQVDVSGVAAGVASLASTIASHSQAALPVLTPLHLAPVSAAPAAPRTWGQMPCDTMFVGNLAPSVTEEELSNALVTLPGYERMKLVGQGTEKAMAFALFESAEACADAIQALNGNAFPSAPSQALTCEFSKNSLGKSARSC